MSYIIRTCPICGKKFHVVNSSRRLAASDAITALKWHMKQRHPTEAQTPAPK